MTPTAPDDLVAKGLDGIRGATAAEPAILEDPDAYARAVDEVVAGLAPSEHADALRRTLLATRSQLLEAGS